MWFTKKGGILQHSLNHFGHINSNLKESFARIKGDMQAIRDWLAYFKDREKDHEQRLKNIESRIEEIGEVLVYMQEDSPATEEQDEIIFVDEQDEKMPRTKVLDDLTDTQKSMFYRLGTLLYESSQQWITTKALAQELYHDKPYDKVRSTISEYISILVESGLVKKKRKGKLTYLSVTEKGLELFEKTKKSKLLKVSCNFQEINMTH